MKFPQLQNLRLFTPDGQLLFITRIARMFGYGFLSVVLVLYLTQVGLSETQIGLLLTLTLVGDTIISLWITTNADRIGRRRMLIVGAFLMVFAGVLFAMTRNFVFLLIAATIGVISPSGYEVGPFLSIEQAALSQIIPNERRTHNFRLVQSRRFICHCVGCAGWRRPCSSPSGLRCDATWKLSHDCDRLCSHWGDAGSPVHPSFFRCRNLRTADPKHSTYRIQNSFWLASFTGSGAQAICFVLHRCFRRGLRPAKHPRLLVSHSFQCPTGDTGKHFLRNEHPCWPFGPNRCLGGLQDRPH